MSEIRPIPGWPGYSISDDGRVFNQYGRQLKGYRNGKTLGRDHIYVHLYSKGKHKNVGVHTLVLETFVGPRPKGFQCRHLDGNTQNNHVSNLQWGTPSDNMQDQLRHGTHAFGRRDQCGRGHKYTVENTLWEFRKNRNPCRKCRACMRLVYERHRHGLLLPPINMPTRTYVAEWERIEQLQPANVIDTKGRRKIALLKELDRLEKIEQAKERKREALAILREIDEQLKQTG